MAKNAAKSPGWNNNIGLLDHSLPPPFYQSRQLAFPQAIFFSLPSIPIPSDTPSETCQLVIHFSFCGCSFFSSHILPRPGPDDFPSRAPAPRCCPVFSDDLPSSQGQNSHPYPRSHCNLFYILRPIRTLTYSLPYCPNLLFSYAYTYALFPSLRQSIYILDFSPFPVFFFLRSPLT